MNQSLVKLAVLDGQNIDFILKCHVLKLFLAHLTLYSLRSSSIRNVRGLRIYAVGYLQEGYYRFLEVLSAVYP